MKKASAIEVLGGLGLIAGLVFVGVEIQQTTVATRAATVQQIKDAWLELNLTLASSPELAAAFETAQSQGFDAVDPAGQIMVTSFYRSLFHNWSSGYSQYLLGTLDQNQWLPHLRDAEAASREPLAWRIWEDWNYVYDDRFRVLMDSFISANGG